GPPGLPCPQPCPSGNSPGYPSTADLDCNGRLSRESASAPVNATRFRRGPDAPRLVSLIQRVCQSVGACDTGRGQTIFFYKDQERRLRRSISAWLGSLSAKDPVFISPARR